MDWYSLDMLSHRDQRHRGDQLVAAFQSFIADDDEVGLRRHLRMIWPLGELTSLLNRPDQRVRRVAAACLGVRGGRGAVLPLVGALRDDDPVLAAAAEDALWRLWFSAAGSGPRRKLMSGVRLIEERRFNAAAATLDDLIEREPQFAEAYHQRGTVRYLQGEWVAAIADCMHAVRLEPCHFGALAGLARAHAELGQDVEALAAYQKAMCVHPQLGGVAQMVRALRFKLQHPNPIPCDE